MSRLKIKKSHIFLIIVAVLCLVFWILIQVVSVNIPSEIEKYIDTKYHTESSFVEYNEEESSFHGRVAVMRDLSGFTFTVERVYYKDGSLGYRDDYLSCKYQKEIESMVESAIPDRVREDSILSKIRLYKVVDGYQPYSEFLSGSVLSFDVSGCEWDMGTCEEFCNNIPSDVMVSAYVFNPHGERVHLITDENHGIQLR